MTAPAANDALPTTADDRRFMALALDLGRRGLGRTWPNPAVGAVLVKDGVIVGRGWTQPGGRPHAEVEALRRAGTAASGATLYVTLEPCSHFGKSPPCADAIVAAGVVRVVSAIEDPNPKVAGAGYARLRAAGITVETGVGADEAQRDHAGHIRRMRDGRPHVMLKLAVSSDGKAGAAGRKPLAITGAAVRHRVHLLRARSDAIMVGIGSVIADDPMLTCRLPGMAKDSPVRVVLDSALRLPVASKLVGSARQVPVWAMTGPASRPAEEALLALGVVVLPAAETDSRAALGRVPLLPALKLLAERGVTRLMLEGGPTLAASFLEADLVDEAVLFRSLKPVGVEGIDALEGLPLTALTQSPRLGFTGSTAFGDDICDVFERR